MIGVDLPDHASRYVSAGNGIQLFTERFGDPSDPAVVIVLGAGNSRLFAYDGFCASLASHGYSVLRYDHRDTGRSSTVDFAQSPYTLDDLARDAAAVCAAAEQPAVHLVGCSFGGGISQLVAIDHPELVRSLTLISSTPDPRPYVRAVMGRPFDGALPAPDPAFLRFLAGRRAAGPPADPAVALDERVEDWKIVFGSATGADPEQMRGILRQEAIETPDPSLRAHHLMALDRAEDRAPRLRDIDCPALVLHGPHDVCLPLPHGEILAAMIPGARLELIQGMGHLFPPAWSAEMAHRVAAHLRTIGPPKRAAPIRKVESR